MCILFILSPQLAPILGFLMLVVSILVGKDNFFHLLFGLLSHFHMAIRYFQVLTECHHHASPDEESCSYDGFHLSFPT